MPRSSTTTRSYSKFESVPALSSTGYYVERLIIVIECKIKIEIIEVLSYPIANIVVFLAARDVPIRVYPSTFVLLDDTEKHGFSGPACGRIEKKKKITQKLLCSNSIENQIHAILLHNFRVISESAVNSNCRSDRVRKVSNNLLSAKYEETI